MYYSWHGLFQFSFLLLFLDREKSWILAFFFLFIYSLDLAFNPDLSEKGGGGDRGSY